MLITAGPCTSWPLLLRMLVELEEPRNRIERKKNAAGEPSEEIVGVVEGASAIAVANGVKAGRRAMPFGSSLRAGPHVTAALLSPRTANDERRRVGTRSDRSRWPGGCVARARHCGADCYEFADLTPK